VGVDLPRPIVRDRVLLPLAAAVIPPGRGWHWTQGLMDLGATRCTARRPRCDGCPVRTWCRAAPEMPAALAESASQPQFRGSSPAYRYDDFKRDRCRPGTGSISGGRADGHRYYRGRVLSELRQLPPETEDGLTLTELGSRLRADYGNADRTWLRGVVDSLTGDGLAIAEERPRYDTGDEAGSDIQVRLPE